jgi:hypothetical protein
MRKKARTTSHCGAELLRTLRNDDFTVDAESQRPARRMGRNTLPLCEWRKIAISLIDHRSKRCDGLVTTPIKLLTTQQQIPLLDG